MRTAFRISLLVNAILAGVVCYQAVRLRTEAPAAPVAVIEAPRSIAGQSGNPPGAGPALTERFDWRQVEAADYPTYIANLRAIKCPEQTVRDIITADVAGLFALKRNQLHLANSEAGAGRWSMAEETNLIAVLFGDPTGPQVASSRPADSAPREAEPVRVPLVFQNQALATLKLNEEQREELGELARQFIEDVGGVSQNPNDPAYLANWLKAQPKFDELIVNVIGRRALVDLDQAMPPPDSGNE